MFDIYRADSEEKSRFLLGKRGASSLMVIGLNPSTATREKSDVTASKVAKVAMQNGFDGFILANLYPLRATNPKNLPDTADSALVQENAQIVVDVVREYSVSSFWAAWGGDIGRREYFPQSLALIAERLRSPTTRWVHFGPLRKDGHPRHPSRLSYRWAFHEFEIDAYLQTFKQTP
ncbi:MAG: DUF1643 domain-containing protein [Cyanobacteria bacterium P01_D01_bin.73]